MNSIFDPRNSLSEMRRSAPPRALGGRALVHIQGSLTEARVSESTCCGRAALRSSEPACRGLATPVGQSWGPLASMGVTSVVLEPGKAGLRCRRFPRQAPAEAALHSLCAESIAEAGGLRNRLWRAPGVRLGRTPEEAEGRPAPRTHHHARGPQLFLLRALLNWCQLHKGVIPFHLMTIPTGSAEMMPFR